MLKKTSVNRFLSNNNNAILHNVFVLYILFIISLLNFYLWICKKDILSILIFTIIGILTSFFNKNMIIILFISIALTNILIPLHDQNDRLCNLL
jgi:hypothetical protein